MGVGKAGAIGIVLAGQAETEPAARDPAVTVTIFLEDFDPEIERIIPGDLDDGDFDEHLTLSAVDVLKYLDDLFVNGLVTCNDECV